MCSRENAAGAGCGGLAVERVRSVPWVSIGALDFWGSFCQVKISKNKNCVSIGSFRNSRMNRKREHDRRVSGCADTWARERTLTTQASLLRYTLRNVRRWLGLRAADVKAYGQIRCAPST